MADQPDETLNDAGLTKPKKPRTEAQKAATERMRTALESKQIASSKITPEEKKLRLQAIKEQLNGPLKKNMDKAPTPKKEAIPDPESEVESEEEEEAPSPPPKPKKKQAEIVPKALSVSSQPKKQPKVIYESASESEEEVIVVKKKKKKPTKKTIIYESASESEEEEPVKPVRKERETKTQQNANSKFKITPGTAKEVKPANPYYFAD
jgi:hypothetical protein